MTTPLEPLQYRLKHLFVLLTVAGVACFLAMWFFRTEPMVRETRLTVKREAWRMHDPDRCRIIYSVQFPNGDRDTYFDWEPYGILDEVRVSGVAKSYHGSKPLPWQRRTEQLTTVTPRMLENFAILQKIAEDSCNIAEIEWIEYGNTRGDALIEIKNRSCVVQLPSDFSRATVPIAAKTRITNGSENLKRNGNEKDMHDCLTHWAK